MPKKRVLSPQSIWDREALILALESLQIGKSEWQASRIWSQLLRHQHSSWHDVDGLPSRAKAHLDAHFVKFSSKLKAVQQATDGGTIKLLIQLQGDLSIESVIMRCAAATPSLPPVFPAHPAVG